MEEYKVKVEQGCPRGDLLAYFKAEAERANRIGEEFVKYYYDGLDTRRNVLSRLYLDTATLIYHGNGYAGKDVIQEFFEHLPLTHHVISSIVSRPMANCIGSPLLNMVVLVTGYVSYSGEHADLFQQQLIISVESGTWKIVSDCFKYKEL